jgi:hypothetical protein
MALIPAAAWFSGCRDQSPERPATTPPAAPIAAPPVDVAPPTAANEDARPGADGGADAAANAPIGAATAMVATATYDLTFERLYRCGSAAAGGATSRGGGEKIWIGAAVAAYAKTKNFFLNARDFTLEKGGLVLEARHVNPPALPRCLPLLQPRQLDASKTARGFVLFEVPAHLKADGVPLVLAYRPTRFGGARRVEFRIPACFDECPESAVAAAPKSERKRALRIAHPQTLTHH